MKNKPLLIGLLLAGLLAVALLVVWIGKGLREKTLLPTGFEPNPTVPAPAALSPRQPDPGQERRWLNRIEQALAEGEETEEILQLVRSRPEPISPAPSVFLPIIQSPSHPIIQSSSPTLPKEPTIREIQLAAIQYAEVMPQKIRRWRTLAQIRNFIPRLTIGLDRDRNTTVASSTSSGKTSFTVGPDDESTSVDFGFTWDLANLVWDPAQTSIDVRSRYMVQLRQDILEETTKLYFERRRLTAEFEAMPTEDAVLQRERALRLEELTAQLDALTGGLYSSS